MRIHAVLVTALLLSSTAGTLAQSLSTPFVGPIGVIHQDGNLFDVQAHRTIRITGFGIHTDKPADGIEIYVRRGGMGDPSTYPLSSLELVATYGPTATAGEGAETALPRDLSITMRGGETVGFYITATNGAGVDDRPFRYDAGDGSGNSYAFNGDLSIYEGYGVEYPFADFFDPRRWNGIIYYLLVADTLVPMARTPNQVATATALDTLGLGTPVFDALSIMSDEDIRAALDQLSGEEFAALQNLMIEQSSIIRASQLQRLQQAFGEIGQGRALGYSAPAAVDAGAGTSVWGSINGGYTRLQGDSNVGTISSGLGGVNMGADTWLGDWRVGAMLTAGTGSASIGDAQASFTDVGGGVYAGRAFGDLTVKLGGAITGRSTRTTRNVTAAGLAQTLSGDYWASTQQLFGELAYGFDLGASEIEPFAQLALVHQSADGFTETGGNAALTVAGSDEMVGFTTLGLRGSNQFVLGQDMLVTVHGSLAWRHALGDAVTTRNTFPGGTPFEISGAPFVRDALVLDAGLDWDISSTVSLSVGATASISDGGYGLNGTAGLTGKF